MKTWSIKAASIILSVSSAIACSSAEQTVNKRQDKDKQAALASFNEKILAEKKASGDATPDDQKPVEDPKDDVIVVEIPVGEAKVPSIKLSADAALASVKPVDVLLANKISAFDFVLFGKDGKSWSYSPAAAAGAQLKAITPIVVNPPGSVLYSLPDNQFWFVAPDKLGRHKAKVDGTMDDAKSVKVEQFSTATFLGDKTKIKVLYASVDEIILHLDTHIAIVSVLPSPQPAQIKQLPIEKLPVDLKGELSAGRSQGGYWFRSAAGLFFLSKTDKADVNPWSKNAFALEPANLSALALWPDEAGLKYVGASLGVSAGAFFTDVVAPIAPATP
ncbi:MAG: hypothetical protein EOP10_07245 [Proteobacteria bacterium]|nr:MAG: hypothetical protein EOP10_07245 [Pseudomonadota bacterium]